MPDGKAARLSRKCIGVLCGVQRVLMYKFASIKSMILLCLPDGSVGGFSAATSFCVSLPKRPARRDASLSAKLVQCSKVNGALNLLQYAHYSFVRVILSLFYSSEFQLLICNILCRTQPVCFYLNDQPFSERRISSDYEINWIGFSYVSSIIMFLP